ncbi:MAG: hypothetical protein V1754_08915, partial [Pseudomonadota bacterium]
YLGYGGGATMKFVFCALVFMFLIGCGSTSSVTDDSGVSKDSGADSKEDTGPAAPLANIYPINPVENQQTTQVELKSLTDPDGFLTGKYANVWNCLNKDGGDVINVVIAGMNLSGKVCKLEKVAKPGEDGTYLHIEPAAGSDPNDTFAEVMMYHHVTSVHDQFKDRLGITHMDNPMRSIVNIQAYIDLFSGWIGIENAAFVPKETGTFLKEFGVDLNKGEDAIIFFQGNNVDMAYDATVIYHEYTHAVIGPALTANAKTQYGVDPSPAALNEGLADYFAASFLDANVIGSYGMAATGHQRDLERDFACPDHVVGETHYDGEIASGALWDLRKILTAEIADQVIANAVLSFTQSTNFDQAAQAILDEVRIMAPDKEAVAQALFEERGMIGCIPLKEHTDYDNTSGSVLSPTYPSPDYLGGVFKDGVPAYLQYKVAIKPNTKELTIEYLPIGGSDLFPGLPIPGPEANVWVALKKGSDPITYDYATGKAVSDALLVLKGTKINSDHRLVLSGNCISEGDLVFQFINKGNTEGQITKVKILQSETVESGSPNFDNCD